MRVFHSVSLIVLLLVTDSFLPDFTERKHLSTLIDESSASVCVRTGAKAGEKVLKLLEHLGHRAGRSIVNRIFGGI